MIGALRGDAVLVRLNAFALAAAVVALAFPAAASASGTTEWLFTGKVKSNDGFALSLVALPNSRHHPTTLEAFLDKRSGSGVGSVFQDSDYTLTRGLRLNGSKELGRAHIFGGFADRRGFINMRFTATGAATKVPVQKGCVGTPGEKRKGTLSGSLVLKADRLGSVRLGSIRSTLVRPPKVTACEGRAGVVASSVVVGRLRHYLNTGPPRRGKPNGVGVDVVKPRGKAPAREEIDTFTRRDGFSAYYDFGVYAPRMNYTSAADLSRAALKGYAGMKGTASYMGTAGVRNPAGVLSSKGKLNGNLSVDMAAIGTVQPFASGALPAFQYAMPGS